MARILIVNPDTDLSAYIALVLRNRSYQVDVWREIAIDYDASVIAAADLVIVSKSYVEQNPQALLSIRTACPRPVLFIDDVGSPARALIQPDLLPLPFHPGLLIDRVEAALKNDSTAAVA